MWLLEFTSGNDSVVVKKRWGDHFIDRFRKRGVGGNEVIRTVGLRRSEFKRFTWVVSEKGNLTLLLFLSLGGLWKECSGKGYRLLNLEDMGHTTPVQNIIKESVLPDSKTLHRRQQLSLVLSFSRYNCGILVYDLKKTIYRMTDSTTQPSTWVNHQKFEMTPVQNVKIPSRNPWNPPLFFLRSSPRDQVGGSTVDFNESKTKNIQLKIVILKWSSYNTTVFLRRMAHLSRIDN